MDSSDGAQNFFTTIHPLEAKIGDLCTMLRTEHRLALVSIDTQSLLEIQDAFDPSIYDTVLCAVERCFFGLRGTELRKDDLILSNITKGRKFYIFLSRPREGRKTEVGDLERIAFRIQEYIYGRLFRIFFPLTQRGPAVRVGYSLAFHSPHLNEKSVLQNVVEEAEAIAPYLDLKYGLLRKTLIQDILRAGTLDVRFSPLFSLDTEAVIGYQASVHAPSGGLVRPSENLMHYARESGFSRELDWLGRLQVLTGAAGLDREKYLFLRTAPEIGMEPLPKSHEFLLQLEKNGLRPERIVFEIDEHQLFFDRSLLPGILHNYPDLQFLVEINGLWLENDFLILQHERIRFVRVAPELIHALADRPEYQKMLDALSAYTHRTGKLLIAAGLATNADLDRARSFGSDIGCGEYFLQDPKTGVLALPAKSLEDPSLQSKLLLSIYLKRGREYINCEDYDKAVLEFSKAIEVDARNCEAYYYRGISFCEEGVFSVAQKDLAKLKELDPEFANTLLLEARIADKRGKAQRAVSLYTEYLDLAEDSLDSGVSFARLRIKALKDEESSR